MIRTLHKAASGIAERLLFGFVLKKSYHDFIALHDLTAAYIAETDDLVRAVLRTDGRVGDVSFERMSGTLSIDPGGGVRLLYDKDTSGPGARVPIDLSGFEEYVEEYLLLQESRTAGRSAVSPGEGPDTLRGGALRGGAFKGSVALFLFDRRQLTFASLFGGAGMVETVSLPKYVSGRPSARLNTRGLLLSMPLNRTDGDILLLALYPYRLVRGVIRTFGLIAIIILTILLLWLIVTYMTAYCKTRGVGAMSGQDKRSDIINEIDQELTVGEKKKLPEKARKVEDSGGKKDEGKRLEEDGIYIGR
ncbi:MAG: hypothetical protein JXQ30_03995 [Spirochaetes bacterium]|nr:hypothetical protein [Spirochaetota bacterium]